VVRHNGQQDKFKFRGAELRIELASGDVLASGGQPAPQTSFGDWAHEEGKVFTAGDRSNPLELKF